ncbi:hypothetical protein F5Y19DRAFT_413913 [Xylariaceae sp. FL1651]|nr:hypothetical protein F5Y19DRAFT_413913 [Xylariaceae sp. FL1651]
MSSDPKLKQQLALLKRLPGQGELSEISSTPLFIYAVLKHAQSLATSPSDLPFSQYALIAGDTESLQKTPVKDPRIFYNVATPSSIFICGSQGSGKSHTLSCILENCLIQSDKLGCLPRPLTGIVFHYDDYVSDSRVAPCEAAYLGSDPSVQVRVLCAPTNISVIKESYKTLKNVTVEALSLDESDLNTKRMLELMAFDKTQPLYVHVIQRILRDMRLTQQSNQTKFNYADFTKRLENEQLMPDQKRALRQRLDTLQSFMAPAQVGIPTNLYASSNRSKKKRSGTDWTPKAGELIIVDLSCPCITGPTACALFNICLSIFLGQDCSIGRVVALDEAHRYMGDSSECETLTNSLLSAIRFQRHLGARIIISTQEPTISPKLLDLCSITIVHRFSSPDWLKVLTKHLAGISTVSKVVSKDNNMGLDDKDTDNETSQCGLRGIAVSSNDPISELFSEIVGLHTGEALVFAPSAIVCLDEQYSLGQKKRKVPKKLAHRVLRVVMRARITTDGGRSIMAV